MGHNAEPNQAVHLKTPKGTKLYGERRNSDTSSPRPVSDTAIAHPMPTRDLKRLTKMNIGRKSLIQSEQHQNEILIEQNTALQKEISLLLQKEAQARNLAYHDGLTGLPNRNLLKDRFQQALPQSERHHKPLALLMVDLDEFKYVNDMLGFANGDKLIQAVATRLSKGIRGADTACRYGGDEFVIMLSEIDSPNIVTTLAAEISWRLSEPYIIDGHNIHMAVSVGVAVYPDNGQTFDDLIKHADTAMRRAKGTGHRTSITKQSMEDSASAELFNLPNPTTGTPG